MNYRVTPPVTAKGRRVWLFMSLLLPALASKVSNQSSACPIPCGGAPVPPCQESRPYLRLLGPPPLRFQDALPPPDLAARPPAGAPPKPHEKFAESDAEPKVAAAAPAAPPPAAPTAPKPSNATASSPAAQTPAVAPLLPDDAQPKVRPDDFLPYFQYPGAASPAAPPAPGTLPPSSATYNQQ